MANAHLVAKLRQLLKDAHIKLVNVEWIKHKEPLPWVDCSAWFDGVDTIELAIKNPRHNSADELVLSVIHELCHMAGYNEEAVAEGLEKTAYTSRALRQDVAYALLNAFLDQ